MQARLEIELLRAADGSVTARGALAVAPFWCRWDGTTLWLVGSAATPVGDDDISLDLHVGEGVQATVRSVAAMIVYAARGAGTCLTTRLQVAPGARLVWQPEPVIVTARARHRSTLVADVADGGTLVADELVVLGRSGETAGGYMATMDLRRADVPICLTSFDTATPGWSGPGGTAGAKVVGTRLVVDPSSAPAQEPTVDARTVVLRPEGGGAIATTLAPEPARARSQLDAALPLPVRQPRIQPTADPILSLVRGVADPPQPRAVVPAGGG